MTSAVYKAVKAFQETSLTTGELAAKIKLDFSSASRIVKQLIAHRLIVEKERIKPNGKGRAAVVYKWEKT